jgi:hypothetical protein
MAPPPDLFMAYLGVTERDKTDAPQTTRGRESDRRRLPGAPQAPVFSALLGSASGEELATVRLPGSPAGLPL